MTQTLTKRIETMLQENVVYNKELGERAITRRALEEGMPIEVSSVIYTTEFINPHQPTSGRTQKTFIVTNGIPKPPAERITFPEWPDLGNGEEIVVWVLGAIYQPKRTTATTLDIWRHRQPNPEMVFEDDVIRRLQAERDEQPATGPIQSIELYQRDDIRDRGGVWTPIRKQGIAPAYRIRIQKHGWGNTTRTFEDLSHPYFTTLRGLLDLERLGPIDMP
ncbi:MAG TPA: hypothetical protein VJB87_04205 [Candidatus Nanoarchaeia archaeon]|nr:hypothetical protein [Candidatus Nanoarchaeia archaeon]